jgi:1-deoxy-D-xylulose-5-phosphate reductoisomerase
LEDRIGFLEMSDVIEKMMQTIPFIASPSYDDLINTDKETREQTVGAHLRVRPHMCAPIVK